MDVLKNGTLVRVCLVDESPKDEYSGVYEGEKDVEGFPWPIPVIRVPELNRVFYGYECWWTKEN